MATAGEKIVALAVDLQAAVDAARAQSAEFADAFGRLNLALGTAVTAAELPDVVRKRLSAAYVDQHTLADYRARTEAAEKRAQDAERELAGSVAIVEAVAEALGLDRHGGDDLPAAVRALKTRCEGAERSASAMDGSAYVRGVERDRDEWRTRALTAEELAAKRNREIDASKDALRNERFISDGLRKDFELAQEAAHKVATMAAEESAGVLKALIVLGLNVVASVWLVGVPLGQTFKVVGTGLLVGLVVEIIARLGKAAEP